MKMRLDRLFQTDRLDKIAILDSNQAVIVTKIERKTEQRDSRPSARRSHYSTPKLKEFGPVGALTQAGSGTTVEMAPGMPGVKSMA